MAPSIFSFLLGQASMLPLLYITWRWYKKEYGMKHYWRREHKKLAKEHKYALEQLDVQKHKEYHDAGL